MVALFGGPSERDSSESTYTTWAIEHGDLSCGYGSPTATTNTFLPEYRVEPQVPPLWPLVSGGLAAVTRLGHEVSFPTQHQMGKDCAQAFSQLYDWAEDGRILPPTTGFGYVTWFALLGGVVMVLRASGRGRRGWEALGVLLVGITPIVWMPLLDYYHPEDILAVGLMLAGISCVLKRQWVAAGVLLGLAVTSQQFALLALLPLLVVVPAVGRWRLLTFSVVSWLCITVPVVALSSGRALSSAVLGTGDAATLGGTVLWETGLRGHPLTVLSRVVPIIVAVAIAWACRRRKGDAMMEPAPLLSLLAVTLSLRLVFEQGLFGYKFLALSVLLIVLAVVRGRVPGYLIGWLALVTLAFNPIPWSLDLNARWWGAYASSGLQTACIVIALIIVLVDAGYRKVRWYLVVGLVVAVAAFGQWPPLRDSLRAPLPLWLWQLLLVGSGVAIAAAPLVSFLRRDEVAPLAVEPAGG